MSALLNLYLADVQGASKISSKGEWAGPCPKCGGRPGVSDRFHVWPEEGKGGAYWCRQEGCELHKRGDAIEYLKLVRGMSYREACAEIGIIKGKAPLRAISPAQGNVQQQTQGDQWEPHGWDAPTSMWRDQAHRLLERCIEQLAGEENQHIRDWLLQSRGIDMESAVSAHLGYCPQDIRLTREKWGLPTDMDGKGKPRRLWIPEGIVIPCWRDGVMHRIRVRRFSKEGKKYIFIQGGSAMPYWIRTHARHAVIVESELDAILINQQAGDLVTTVALGSVSMRPDPELHAHLVTMDAVLVALDTGDKSLAGAKAAWGWWAQHYSNARRCPVVGGKDPTDAQKNGLDLRAWVQAALDGGAQRMRVDGGQR